MIYQDVLASATTTSFIILPNALGITTSDSLSITNDSSNIELTSTFVSAVYDSNNILTVSFSLPTETLDEGNFYIIELTKNVTNAVLWRGLMFVSSQDKVDYTINKDEFKEKTSNNDYIILD